MTKRETDIETLRALYQKSVQQPGTDDCPDEERLATLVLGEIEGEARRRMADHVVGCARCTEATRLLMELHRDARGKRSSLFASSWVRLAAAAVVLVALGLLLRGTPPVPSPDVERGASTMATTPTDGASLDEAPETLEWPTVAGATGYRVRLFDARAEPLWESESTAEPRIALPSEVRARFTVGSA